MTSLISLPIDESILSQQLVQKINSVQANGTSSLGFVINGQCANDQSGYSVSSAGDINGDGLNDLIIGAPNNDFADNDAGKAYVIWGKTSNGSIDLSAVASGIGGFVIHGIGGGDNLGASVAAAGDVNGDGLADLIVGLPGNDSSKSAIGITPAGIFDNVGGAFVIFGKTDTSPVIYDASSNNRRTTGTPLGEIILGAAGDDTLTGGGGTDVILGGAGNDLIIINQSNIDALQTNTPSENTPKLARIDGGAGIDTLRLTGGANLDFTQIKQLAATNTDFNSRVSGVEKIDLATDTAANTVKISLNDVLDMAAMNLFNTSTGSGWAGAGLGASVSKHQVAITGNATDTVDLADGTGTANWTKAAGTASNNGISYDIWNHNTAAAQLLIQVGMTVI